MSHGRTAIVTGGGKRVGDALVRALLEDGWTVVAHVHRDEDEVADGAIKTVADLAEADCAKRIFAAARGLPSIGLLVNNAARFSFDGLGATNADEFDAHMRVNARAPMLLIDQLAAQHDGMSDALVVNLLDAKLSSPNPDFLSYTVSKYALAGLGEIAARALAEKGIRVNSLAPALMLPSGKQDEENFAAVHGLNPLKRGTEIADVVAAMRYLVDSPGVTGQTLVLDGGQRFMKLERDVQFLETK